MAKQVSSFYKKFFIGLLLIPICKLIGIGPAAYAAASCGTFPGHNSQCDSGDGCTGGSVKYETCGTNQLQKYTCTACAAESCGPDGLPNNRWTGGVWVSEGSCTTYISNCSYVGQTKSEACSNEVGSGNRTLTCKQVIPGIYMYDSGGQCIYTSCNFSDDTLENGSCYCSTTCTMPDGTNGYGAMVAEVRTSSVCPASSSSSSEV